MKGTDEKVIVPGRDKATKRIPTTKLPSQPSPKNTPEITTHGASGIPKKVQPEEWKGGQSTERQNKPGINPVDVNEIENIEIEEPTR